MPIPIIIDHREDDKVKKLFLDDPDFEVVIDQNSVADYIIGTIAVERKEWDFLSSLGGGKLERQLIELRTNFPRCLLVIIGSLADKVKWGDNPKTPPKRYMQWMLGSIADFALRLGVTVIMVQDRDEFVELMRQIAKDSKKLVADGPVAEVPVLDTAMAGAVTFKKSDRSPRAVQRDLLRALAGISAKKANLLLDTYGSPTEVAIAANEGRLTKEVDGIGPKTQQAIIEAFLVRTEGS